jgi:hypothetical protein
MTEIKLRAERRMGELLRATERTGERETRGGDRKSKSIRHDIDRRASVPTLKSLGITRDQSSQSQQPLGFPTDLLETSLAAIPEHERETDVGGVNENARGSDSPLDRE